MGYGLSETMEQAVAALCATSPRFWSGVGAHLDPEQLDDERAQLVVKAVAAIARDQGQGPAHRAILEQRLSRWLDEGAIRLGRFSEALVYVAEAERDGLPPIEQTIAEVAPVIQRQRQQEVLREGLKTWSQRGDFEEIVRQMAGVTRIGHVDLARGHRVDASSIEAIRRIKMAQRLALGIEPVDEFLDGGLVRQGVGLLVGGTGEGKSMGLSHAGAEAMWRGHNALYATLEISESEVMARIIANLTGVPINHVKDGTASDVAASRMREFFARPPGGVAGTCIVKEFEAGMTRVEDVIDWVDTVAAEEGEQADVLIIDYVDRLGGPKGISSSYELGKVQMDTLRNATRARDMWTWTASASKAKTKDSAKRRTAEAVADSQHKSRISDLVITLNLSGEDEDEIEYYVAKHRQGAGRRALGPYPHEFHLGRMAPYLDRGPWT